MNKDDLLQYSDMLFRTAITKTHNEYEAEELVQMTYLCALVDIANNKHINYPKAYLISVLNNQFYMMLRKKYKISTVSFEEIPIDIADENDDFAKISETDDAKNIRQSLAFLVNIYREVMVRYYMQNQSVNQISKALQIPKGTILSRLDMGRQKIRKGVDKMENYTKNSYQPEILTLGMNGRTGMNNEPFSCINGSLDQNLLIMAYEKPLTIQELTDGLGVPAAFIEEIVQKLVDSQLMAKIGTKVYTNFLITSLQDNLDGLEICKKYADETFDAAQTVFADAVSDYRKIKGLSTFTDTQLYILAVLSIENSFISTAASQAIRNQKLFEDFPDRPNYGKWEAVGTRYPNGYKFDNEEISKYSVSGLCSTDDINENISRSSEWDTAIGHTHQMHLKYTLTIKERVLLLDAFRCNTVNAFQAEMIPDLLHYGFIKEEGEKNILAIPVLTKAEYEELHAVNHRYVEKLKTLLLDKTAQVLKANVLKYPKHIPESNISDTRYRNSLHDLPMAYIYCAEKQGIIEIEKGKCYPVMYMVLK